jgi:hypothetical protein
VGFEVGTISVGEVGTILVQVGGEAGGEVEVADEVEDDIEQFWSDGHQRLIRFLCVSQHGT